jgi:glucose-6-phosphate 1-dehydrogenase
MNIPHSDALVFFGATGDLVYKKSFPALYAMERRRHLQMPVIGVARSNWTIEKFRARARASIAKQDGFDEAVFAKLSERLHYISCDYSAPVTHAALRKELGDAEHPLHFLAIPPSVFGKVVEGLGQSGCASGARVIVEKPFGRDLPSAQALSATLHTVFDEPCVFRTLFAGQDGVEAAWAVVQPILGLVTPVHDYQPGTWGPSEAEKLTTGICGCDSPVWLLPHGTDGGSN